MSGFLALVNCLLVLIACFLLLLILTSVHTEVVKFKVLGFKCWYLGGVFSSIDCQC